MAALYREAGSQCPHSLFNPLQAHAEWEEPLWPPKWTALGPLALGGSSAFSMALGVWLEPSLASGPLDAWWCKDSHQKTELCLCPIWFPQPLLRDPGSMMDTFHRLENRLLEAKMLGHLCQWRIEVS